MRSELARPRVRAVELRWEHAEEEVRGDATTPREDEEAGEVGWFARDVRVACRTRGERQGEVCQRVVMRNLVAAVISDISGSSWWWMTSRSRTMAPGANRDKSGSAAGSCPPPPGHPRSSQVLLPIIALLTYSLRTHGSFCNCRLLGPHALDPNRGRLETILDIDSLTWTGGSLFLVLWPMSNSISFEFRSLLDCRSKQCQSSPFPTASNCADICQAT